MAPKKSTSNPLLITGQAVDTSVNVQLHPLVLLTISDYITRHTLRGQQGIIVGAIIGQQQGRNFTLEHAFECKLAESSNDDILDGAWFTERLDMYKEVHKAPALDLVAIFTLGPLHGPQAVHIPLVKQVQTLTSSDSIMLLLFHPEQVDNLQGGKLPISLYESVEEVNDEQMSLRFRELSFEVETGEAERIAVDFVAKGGGNATAVPKFDTEASAGASSSKEKITKGKGKAKERNDEDEETLSNILSPEEEELLASLNAKVNAIKMLSQRIQLIQAYLDSHTLSYLTKASSTAVPPENTNFPLLRSISSMVARLQLLAPPNPSAPSHQSSAHPTLLDQAREKERQDVELTSLLASLTRSVSEVSNLGSKFSILHREKTNKERPPYGRGAPGRIGPGGGDEGVMAEGGGL